MVTDPIADYLTRIRNAVMANHRIVEIPSSKIKKEITKILARTDVPYIAVDSYPEYVIVKKHSHIPILILGETLLENYSKFDHKITTFCVYNT